MLNQRNTRRVLQSKGNESHYQIQQSMSDPEAQFDPNGSYTGIPQDIDDVPTQDVDDL